MGVMNDTCTGDPATATVRVVTACMAEASAAYRADVGPIFDELVALRDPSQAMIRVTDVWQFLYPTFQAAGTLRRRAFHVAGDERCGDRRCRSARHPGDPRL